MVNACPSRSDSVSDPWRFVDPSDADGLWDDAGVFDADVLDAAAEAAVAEAWGVWAGEDARAAVDIDHAVAWRDGGPTSAANLGALHRRHHRAKTHHGWHIEPLEPNGSLTWTSPHGLHHTRPPDPTLDASLPDPQPPPEPAPPPAPGRPETPPF